MEYLGIPFSVKNTPCLQPDFLPFAPWRTAYLSQARQPFRIAVEGSGTVVHETRIRGGSPADLRYLERTIKLLLWSCLLYTSDAADDSLRVDLGGRRIIKKKFFSSRRRHTRSCLVSWARRCV